MFIPVGDHPNPRGIPYVNWLLIGLNVGIYFFVSWPLLSRAADLYDPATVAYLEAMSRALGVPARALARQVTAYDVFVFQHGYIPASPSLIDLFSSMFLHAGFLHLAGNMLFLWIYGDNVEHRLGRVGYLVCYLATGVAATVGHAFFSGGSTLPLIGASGAISGVLGFYFVWFPRNTVKVLLILFPFFVNVIELPARWVLGFYLVLDNLLPLAFSGGGGTGVAYGAHIGGFLGGVALAVLVSRLKAERTAQRFAPRMAAGIGTVDAVTEALGQGKWGEAAQRYLRMSRAELARIPARTALEIARWLEKEVSFAVAKVAYRRLIGSHPRGPHLAEAYLGLGLSHLRAGDSTTAYQHLLTALDLDPSPREREIIMEALATIAQWQRRRRSFY